MTNRLRGALILLLATTSTAVAQDPATLRGFITDASDGQPLAGSHVVLVASDSSLYGTITDADGFYSIANAPEGVYTLRVSFVGYKDSKGEISLSAGELTRRDVRLEPWDEAFEEVIVQGEREETGGTLKSAGVQAIKPADIERIPLPGLSPDLASYLTQLPGIVSSGDRGGVLYIRGGSPSENGVFLDGMLLYQPFHILGFYSAFPSDLVSQADIYAGGFGSEFGGRLSAVIDVATRTGNKTGFTGSASLSPFIAAARLEGPVVPGSVSFLASYRRSLVEEIGADLIDEPLPYRFGDAFGKLHANISPSVQASVTGIATHDRGFIAPPEAVDPSQLGRSDEIAWANRAAGARFLVLPATLPILAEVLISYSYFENAFGPEPMPTRRSEISRAGGLVKATYFARDVDVRFGLSASTLELDNELGGLFQDIDDSQEFLTEGWAYLETEFKSLPGLQLTTGARVHSYPSVSRTTVEPRVRALWEKGLHQLSAAAGLYSQEITGLNDRRDAGDVFTAWVPTEDIGEVPSASHLIAGYRFRATNRVNLSIEAFYKDLSNLFVPEWTAFPRFTTSLQLADGSATGLDVRAELDARNFHAFAAYGYTKVEYESRQSTLLLWFGTPTLRYDPPHDRRHQITTTATASLEGFDLTALWRYGSGTPYTRAIGFDQYVLMSDTYEVVDVRDEPGLERVIYGSPYADRLPNYHRLDLSIARTFRMGSHLNATLKFDLINAYDRHNLLYLDLFTLARVDQLPRFYSFGLRIDFR